MSDSSGRFGTGGSGGGGNSFGQFALEVSEPLDGGSSRSPLAQLWLPESGARAPDNCTCGSTCRGRSHRGMAEPPATASLSPTRSEFPFLGAVR